jgi:hypothetical protein
MITTRPKSYFQRFDIDPPKGQEKLFECDVMACQHCGKQVFIPKGGLHDVGDLCRHCWGFICPACVKLGTCNPLEKQLIESERTGKPINPYRLPE